MLFQFMPRLADEEYAALESSIKEHGIQVPVILDENGSVIDGHHRKEIADRLGIDYPKRTKVGLSETDKRTLALTLNIDRRHLSREQKRRLVAESVKADPELSDREHGRRTGVHHTTVGTIRQDLESTGEISHSVKRVSADGRERPASQPEREILIRPAPEPAESDVPEGVDPATGEVLEVEPAPPARVTGLDGKTYTHPQPSAEARERAEAERAAQQEWAAYRDLYSGIARSVSTLAGHATRAPEHLFRHFEDGMFTPIEEREFTPERMRLAVETLTKLIAWKESGND